jgi:hypothetical protein
MTRISTLFLACILALSVTGCGKNGLLAFAAGMELVAATATLANTVAAAEEEQRAREALARAEARREAQRARAAAAPPVVVVVQPAPQCGGE